LDTILHNPHLFLSSIQDVDLFFCNNLSLSRDRILVCRFRISTKCWARNNFFWVAT